MPDPTSPSLPYIPPEFEDLALLLKSIPGVDDVPLILNGPRSIESDALICHYHLDPQAAHELFIALLLGAGAIGKKSLDIAGDMVEEYLKRKKVKSRPKSVVIFDANGKEIRRVELKTPN